MINFLRSMNIPRMSFSTYKKYEREIGPIIELVAKKSCIEACQEEKELTIKNLEKLKNTLPKDIDNNVLAPECFNSPCSSRALSKDVLSEEAQIHQYSKQSKIYNNHEDHTVRIVASYDMGWSKRGTGHQYDSLNDYGHLIGTQSGRVLNYATRNRKCRMCDANCSKKNHDCCLNYFGTAKAMEADVAVELVTQNPLLKL